MSLEDYVNPLFPTDAFVATALHYVRYRVPYPRALLQDLIQRAGVTGDEIMRHPS